MKQRSNVLKANTKHKPTRRADASKTRNERLLIEFPSQLLDRVEQAARDLRTNRSELIRSAVEQFLNDIEAKGFERQLAAGYAANADLNRSLAAEFAP